MPTVTFQVLEGIDKGRSFRELPTPVSIGREEGNLLRLNDERVSRFHAKIQFDNGEMILTDLESTNGTRVNGNVVQIRRLRPGDRIGLGRSLLLYGSETEIAARLTTMGSTGTPPAVESPEDEGAATLHASSLASEFDHDANFDLNAHDKITTARGALFHGTRPLPPLPEKMSPSQAARMAEILDFLHHHLSRSIEQVKGNEEATEITLNFVDWQGVLAVQNLLAKYLRAVTEPDALGQGDE